MKTCETCVVVGVGHSAQNIHMPILQSLGIQLAGVVDLPQCESRIRTLIHEKDTMFYTDLESALSEISPSFVVICTPPMELPKHLDVCVEHNCPVLAEKPLIHTLLRGERFDNEAGSLGRMSSLVGVVDNWPYLGPYAKARELLTRTDIASCTLNLKFELLRNKEDYRTCGVSNWRNNPQYVGASALWDLGWHCLSVFSFLLNESISCLQIEFVESHVGFDLIHVFGNMSQHRIEIAIDRNAPERKNYLQIKSPGWCIDIVNGHLTFQAGNVQEVWNSSKELASRRDWFEAYQQGVLDNYHRFLIGLRRGDKSHDSLIKAMHLSRLISAIEEVAKLEMA